MTLMYRHRKTVVRSADAMLSVPREELTIQVWYAVTFSRILRSEQAICLQ
jgi:hypothetical protein